jgi:ferrous-iron efflux pump FieF
MTNTVTSTEDANAYRAARNGRLVRSATYASVGVAALLISIKTVAFFATNSVAMLSSLVDSLLDILASLVTLVAVRHAQIPADREHRFGHGKAEALSALAQSAFIIGSAVLLVIEAASRLVHPRAIERPEIGIYVIGASIVVTLALVSYQHWVVRQTNSVAIGADSLHYRADLLLNAAVLGAIILSSWFGLVYADPVFAALIAVYIAYNAWKIVQGALDMLMDRELPADERQNILAIANTHPDARHIHDLRTRRSGATTFIQLHLEMDPELSLLRAHEIADEVEAAIQSAYPDAEIIIHQDPEGIEEWHPTYG